MGENKKQNHAFQKKDRKAWIRILEAFLAILIIIASVLIIMSRKPVEADISDEVYQKQRQILEIISKNDNLRAEIINPSVSENNPVVNDFISQMAQSSWNFSTNICNINENCPHPISSSEIYEKNVYATEVIVTSNLTYYNPKKLRFFVWMK